MLESEYIEDIIELLKDNSGYAEILQRAVELESRLKEESFLFNWEDLPGISDERLLDLLYQQFGGNWIKEAIVTKPNTYTICVRREHYKMPSITIIQADSTIATINDDSNINRTYKFNVENPHTDKIQLYRSGLITWEWHDVQGHPQSINKMIVAGIIKVAYKTNKRTEYALVDRDAVKAALKQIEYDQTIFEFEDSQPGPDQTELEVPDDAFDIIVGYDDIKSIIRKGLGKDKPVNVLFIGPPGTAKSMFLEELNRIPGSSYHLGSSSTKAGLTDFLFDMEPRTVLIDELEKMDSKDYAVLLSLMEGGKVVETKKNRRREITVNTAVFASCNSVKKIPAENLSRFHFKFNFTPYTESEFEDVVQRILVTREGVENELARYIAESMSKITKDVREAVGISRICDTPEDVDSILKTRDKYSGVIRC